MNLPSTLAPQGTVTASLIRRKLDSYPCQNGLGLALREVWWIERDDGHRSRTERKVAVSLQVSKIDGCRNSITFGRMWVYF
jgi:hypothetical protein